MFDIGFWEILLILVLALVILGPERLPHAARTVGYWVGKARRYIEGVKTQVEKEFDSGELKRILHNQEIQIKELQGKLGDTLDDSQDYINEEYHNLFEDKNDPGTDPALDSDTIDTPEPQYEILEEDASEDEPPLSESDSKKITEKPE